MGDFLVQGQICLPGTFLSSQYLLNEAIQDREQNKPLLSLKGQLCRNQKTVKHPEAFKPLLLCLFAFRCLSDCCLGMSP